MLCNSGRSEALFSSLLLLQREPSERTAGVSRSCMCPGRKTSDPPPPHPLRWSPFSTPVGHPGPSERSPRCPSGPLSEGPRGPIGAPMSPCEGPKGVLSRNLHKSVPEDSLGPRSGALPGKCAHAGKVPKYKNFPPCALSEYFITTF